MYASNIVCFGKDTEFQINERLPDYRLPKSTLIDKANRLNFTSLLKTNHYL